MSYVQRRRFLWALFIIGLALLAAIAEATTLVRLGFSDLVHYSYSIARVRAVRAQTHLENGEIWTDTTFRVLSQNKGYLPEEIVVRQPGGKFLHLHSHVEGSPEFRPGEELYLFHIVGWSQGTFRIRRDAHSGVEMVTQESAETPVFDPATETFTKTGVKNLPAEIFEQRIRREALRQGEIESKPKKKSR